MISAASVRIGASDDLVVRIVATGSSGTCSASAAAQVVHAVAGQRRDHEGARRTCACVVGGLGAAPAACRAATRSILLRIRILRVRHARPAARGSLRPPRRGPFARRSARRPGRRRARRSRRSMTMARSSRRLRREDARRVDQDDLRVAVDGDAAHQRARRLHLVRDDGDLGADQRVEQRRLAGVGRADQRDETAARIGRRTGVCASVVLLQRSSTLSSFDALAGRASPPRRACSAARLEPPSPSAGGRSGNSTATRNSGSWCGPVRVQFLAIGRRRQPARLRPFLQHGLGVAQRPRGLHHALLPELRSTTCVGGGIAAVEKDRADQRPRRRRRGSSCAGGRRHAIPTRRA